MRFVLALMVALATISVSGCFAGSGEPISLRAGLGDARDAAAAWGSNPAFAGAFAIEPFKRIQDTDEDGTVRGEFITHLDSKPGDGRAPGWVYLFITEDGRCVGIALASGLGVLAEGWEECEEDDLTVVPSEFLDSVAVAGILSDLEGWPTADDATTMTWALEADEEEGAYWLVTSSNMTQSVAAAVDALTGEATVIDEAWADDVLFAEEGMAADEVQSSRVYGSAQTVTVATPLEVDLEVGDEATVTIAAIIGTSVVGQATLLVVAPDGSTVYDEDFLGDTEATLDLVEAGTYTLRITHGNAALSPSIEATATWTV